jgi:hypothetical protein
LSISYPNRLKNVPEIRSISSWYIRCFFSSSLLDSSSLPIIPEKVEEKALNDGIEFDKTVARSLSAAGSER